MGATDPAGHCVHEVLPTAEYEPGPQVTQADCPVVAEYVPLGHFTCSVRLEGRTYLPATASVHTVAPKLFVQEPRGQAVQLVAAALTNVPGVHCWHELAPGNGLYHPTRHCVQVADCGPEYFPAGHTVQVDTPPADLVPAGHTPQPV